MGFGQIIAALRHNRIGAVLILAQIALTLAIVCNSLSIVQQYLRRAQRPTGIDESNIVVIDNQFIGSGSDRQARLQEDLAALRSLPGVVDAVATDALPLVAEGENGWLTLKPAQGHPTSWAGYYRLDDHALTAFGARLIAGRWFSSEEVRGEADKPRAPKVVVVSSALARALFPAGDALGKKVYYVNFPVRIVGILSVFEADLAPLSWGEPFAENSVLGPGEPLDNRFDYVVRTHTGQLDAVMHETQRALLSLSRARVIRSALPFSAVRLQAYRDVSGLDQILVAVSVLLLVVTALGIVGVTTYWVAQRRRQIGILRALGARQADVLRYFHTENLLIAGLGSAIGIALTLALNLWVVERLQIERMNVELIALGGSTVLALSQAVVVWPAWRAASVPPAVAARAV